MVELDKENILDNDLKKGFAYISERTSQLRYSDKQNTEQWLQPVSTYKALEVIKRGQPVSVATSEEFDKYAKKISYNKGPEGWITNTTGTEGNNDISIKGGTERLTVGQLVYFSGSPDIEYEITNVDEGAITVSRPFEKDVSIGESLRVVTFDKEYYESLLNDPDSFIVLTNTTVHKKCIGLAAQPAQPGDEIHIQPFGKFIYDTDYETNKSAALVDHTDTEYNPHFTYEDVGKKVYVKYPDTDSEYYGNGYLTVDENEVYRYYHNIICLGYLTDAPVYKDGEPQSTKTVIEVSIQGDDRGPLDATQFEGTLGEDVYISEDDRIRVFALGQEYDTAFKYRLRFTPQGMDSYSPTDFIAVQKMDGRTAYICFNDKFNPNSLDIQEDKFYAYLGRLYDRETHSEPKIIYVKDLSDYRNRDQLIEGLEKLSKALVEAFEYVSGFKCKEPIIKYPSANTEYYGTVDIESEEVGGYFEVYQSVEVKKHFADSYTYCNGSYENHGKIVLADIRVGARRNLIGIYNGAVFGKLPKGFTTVFMRQGEYTLPKSNTQPFELGEPMYLGAKGTVTRIPYNQYDFISRVCTLKEDRKLLIDVTQPLAKYNGDLPAGYMKPSIYDGNGGYHAEFGFVLMDGKTAYGLDDDRFKLLYERLCGWYDMTLYVDQNNNTFKVPKVVRMIPDDKSETGQSEVYMQIKYIENGIFETVPRIPFLRSFGTFEAETEDDIEEVKANINPVDITVLVDTGVNENGIAIPDMDSLDIHLFVDPDDTYVEGDAHDWREIKEGFFNYNNSITYGYQWKIRRLESVDSHCPYGKYEIYADIGESRGIAYVTDKNQAPRKLTGCHYKVYVSRRECFMKQFDIDQVFKAYLTNNVYDDDANTIEVKDKAVTGKAVLDAIENRYNVTKLISRENATINFGSIDNYLGNIISPIGDLQFASKNEIPIVSSKRVIISNEPDKTIDSIEMPKFVFENGVAKIENSKVGNIRGYELNENQDGNKYVVDGNIYATIGQIRDHSDLTIDGYSYINNYIDKSVENGLIHGMVFGYRGNVNASTLEGVGIRVTGSKDIIENVKRTEKHDPYIPFREFKSALKDYSSSSEGFVEYYATDPIEEEKQNVIALSSVGLARTESNVERTLVKRNFFVDGYTDAVEDYINVSSLSSDPNGKATVAFKTVYNIKEKQIEFLNTNNAGLESMATIRAGGFNAGSLSKYKRIYGETYRAYKNYQNLVDGSGSADDVKVIVDCKYRMLHSTSVKYNDNTNAFKTIIGSALQAAYEMPLAYWQYNTDREWYKKYFGLIVERVEDVASFISPATERELFSKEELVDENKSVDYQDNTFHYTEEESNSIREYLTNIIDNSSSSQNILSTVGLLLKASQETQERLLKLEASTFGDDASTIPGGRKKRVFKGLPNISPAPTNYGLNRLIRAICLEIYNTANPFENDVHEGNADTTSSLSRIDQIIWDIEGKKNDSDETQTTSALNKIQSINASTYPYPDVIDAAWENRHAEFHDPELEYMAETGRNVSTRINSQDIPDKDDEHGWTSTSKWLWNTDENGNYIHAQVFNGIHDAINRITAKINALTYSIHNEDNICSEPVRLNTIRQNIEHMIRETYFDDKYVIKESEDGHIFEKIEAETYHDVNGENHRPYFKDISRFDKLTKDLYSYAITTIGMESELDKTTKFGEETSEFTKNENDEQQQVYISNRKFNGKRLLIDYAPDTQAKEKDGKTIVETAKLHIPQNLNDYEYASIIDIILDAIGEQYFRKIHNELNKNREVVYWDTTSNSQKDDENKLSTYKDARLNRTITERLALLESALDNVVQKLSRTPVFEKDTSAKDWLTNNYADEHEKHTNETSSQVGFGRVYSIEEYINELNAWLGYSQEKGGKYTIEETDITHSYKNVWHHGLKDGKPDEDGNVGTSAEWAVKNSQRMNAAIEDLLYRLQEEEKKTTRLNAILGNEFDTNVEAIKTHSQSNSWDNSNEDAQKEDQKVLVESHSSYNITEDIKDLLLTIYGVDNENDTVHTDYVHRSLVNNGESVYSRFALAGTSSVDDHNHVYRNIIDDFVHEMYFNPQSYILEPIGEDGNDWNYVESTNSPETDSRRAVVYDFDSGKNLYDIPDGEVAISFNNRKEFFNDIQSTNTDEHFIDQLNSKYNGNFAHYRQSRFDIIEDEIRHLRKLLGLNFNLDSDTLGFEYSTKKSHSESESARNLKYKGELAFTVLPNNEDPESFEVKFNAMEFFGNDIYDSTNKQESDGEFYDQYNRTGSTNILSFLINNDKSNRLLRTELGYHSTDGYSRYYDINEKVIQSQPKELYKRRNVYDRLYTLEQAVVDIDKFNKTVKSLEKVIDPETGNVIFHEGEGNIIDILRRLGSYEWVGGNVGDNVTFDKLDKDNVKVEERVFNDNEESRYNNITEELKGHNEHLASLYSTIGVDLNLDRMDTFANNELNADGTEKKQTIWGRLNALETLNEHDLDAENILTAEYKNGIVEKRFLKSTDTISNARTIETLVSIFDGNIQIFSGVIEEGKDMSLHYNNGTILIKYADGKVSLSSEDFDLTNMSAKVSFGKGVAIASTAYVDSISAKNTDELHQVLGDKTSHIVRAYTNISEKEVYGNRKPITVEGYSKSNTNLPSENYYPTEVTLARLVDAMNGIITKQQTEINTLQNKLSDLSELYGSSYDDIKTVQSNHKLRTTSSLIKFN